MNPQQALDLAAEKERDELKVILSGKTFDYTSVQNFGPDVGADGEIWLEDSKTT